MQAPEVYEHKDYSCTDVFALGMLIYFMFTGERPFANAISEEIPSLVKAGKRPDIRKLVVQYQELVTRCWEHGMYQHTV